MDHLSNPQAGIDGLEHLAYLIAEAMVAELDLQAGAEMLNVLKAAETAEMAQAGRAQKPKTRAAGGR